MESLPPECLSHIVSFTSPGDACRAAAVSASFRVAADSDLAWNNLLPPDYREILTRSVSPVKFSSKKDLFHRLSSPLLVDGGKMTISIDKSTNKRCCMLSARELSIPWSTNSLCWSWKPLLGSRFPEVVELIMVCWLEINGKLNTRMSLSPNTTYNAFIVIQLRDRAFGLDKVPFEISVGIGGHRTRRTVYLELDVEHKSCDHFKARSDDEVVRARGDTWLEVELGEFYNDSGNDEDMVLEMWFGEIKGVHLKGGIVVQGIELRPKN